MQVDAQIHGSTVQEALAKASLDEKKAGAGVDEDDEQVFSCRIIIKLNDISWLQQAILDEDSNLGDEEVNIYLKEIRECKLNKLINE